MDLFENRKSLASQVAQEIASDISRGRWDVGVTLPSIRELAGIYGTSFSTAQAALRQLEMYGMVETRPRRNSIVKSRDFASGPKPSHQSHIIIAGFPAMTEMGKPGEPLGWAARVGQAAERTFFDAGYNITKIPFDTHVSLSVEEIMQRVDHLGSMRAGMLMHGQSDRVQQIASELDRRDLPWVTINRPAPDVFHNFVSDDNIFGCQRVGRYFAQLGIRKVLILSTDVSQVFSWMERTTGVIQGYLQVTQSLEGMHYMQCPAVSEEAAYETARAFIKDHGPPQAIFGTGDELAFGGLRACMDHGMRVPEDICAIGAAGLERYRYTDPSLAAISQPMEEIGKQAAKMLLTMIPERIRRMSGCMIPCRLIARQSLRVPEHLRGEVDEIEYDG